MLEEIVNNLKSLTNDISSVLETKEKLKSDDISIIKSLYNKRRVYLNKLDQWVNSEAGSEYIQTNNEQWQQLISFFIGVDKRNLAKLEGLKVQMADELKNKFKQKSLLIYQKG